MAVGVWKGDLDVLVGEVDRVERGGVSDFEKRGGRVLGVSFTVEAEEGVGQHAKIEGRVDRELTDTANSDQS